MATLDTEAFWSRLGLLFSSWEKGGKNWGASEDSGSASADAFALVTGTIPDGINYTRSGSLQAHLFGYSVSDSVFIFTRADKTLHIFCTAKRMSFFSSAGSTDRSGALKVKLHEKIKGSPEADAEAAAALVKSSGAKLLGVLAKDKPQGLYAGRVRKVLLEDSRLEQTDVTPGIAGIFTVKDASALASVRQAGAVAATALARIGFEKATKFATEGRTVTHRKWSSLVEKALLEAADALPGIRERGIESEDIEVACTPLIQSGGDYDFKPFTEPTEERIDYDTMVVAVGARFRSYCAHAARTLFVAPTEEHTAAYQLLLDAAAAAAAKMVPGGRLRECVEAAEAVVRDKRPDWVEKLTKTCGSSIGLEFREAQLALNASSAAQFTEGMVFNLALGLTGLKPGQENNSDGKRKEFAVYLADTYIVRAPASAAAMADADDDVAAAAAKKGPECLTADVPKELAAVTIAVAEGESDDDEEEGGEADGASKRRAAATEAGAAAGGDARRARAARAAEEAAARASEEENRRAAQRDLAQKRAQEALERYANHDGKKNASDALTTAAARVKAYSEPSKMPAAARPNRLTVDRAAKAVLVPINGQLVPFHVSLIKSVRHSQVGAHYVLRITFATPDAKGSTESLPPGSKLDHTFIKEVSFRTKSPSALAEVHTVLESMRKEAVAAKKDAEAAATAGVSGQLVEQPPLRLLQQPAVRLREVSCRPAIGSGTGTRKSPGVLTAHANGFRYMTKDRDGTAHVDIIYENVKSCFLQRASARDSQVVIHLELRHPIKIGASNAKKSAFLQFFYEVADAAQDVSTANSRYDDEDEMRAEREEERRREEWNQRFSQFAEGCDKLWEEGNTTDLKFERPFRKLMFTGVAHKENVELFPTTHCLIALDDRPRPLVVTISDIELASLERVNFNHREFDMVLLFKDYARTPATLSSVPLKYLEAIKSWLTAVGVLYHEFPSNIRWSEVMPEILRDVRGFFEDGGWATLDMPDSDEEGGGGGSGSGSGSDASEASGSEYEASESVESESDEFTSDADETSESGSGSGGYDGDDDEDSEGLDWDELEEKTKKEERSKAAQKGSTKGGSDSDSD